MPGLAEAMPHGNVPLDDVAQQVLKDLGGMLPEIARKTAVVQIREQRIFASTAATVGEVLRVAERKHLERQVSAGKLCPQFTAQQGGV